MEIQGLPIVLPLKNTGLQVGQRILVEVMNCDSNGKAQIRIAGQEISALLEITAQEGERFWAEVKKMDESGLLLVREKNNNHGPLLSIYQQENTRLNPLKSDDISISKALIQILKHDLNPSNVSKVMPFVQKYIPLWSDLNGENGKRLWEFIRAIGYDYEHRVRSLIQRPQQEDQLEERNALGGTLKGIVLSLMSKEAETGGKTTLSNLLDYITGQQLWLKGEPNESPFYLFEFPIRLENEIFQQRFAVKAARKGNKINLDHCRIALHAKTPKLGDIGVEGWLYDGRLTIQFLSDNPLLPMTIVEENLPEAKERLQHLGIFLHVIGVSPLNTAQEFHRFLRGEYKEGVNIQV